MAQTVMVSGLGFLKALEAAGVLQAADKTRRVVIDATVDAPLRVYIENIGDERVLEVLDHPDLQVAVKIRAADDESV